MNNKLNLIIGVIIVLTPFSGFPRDFKTIIFILAGFVIVAYSLKNIRLEHKKKHHHKNRYKEVFVESKPQKSSSKNVVTNTEPIVEPNLNSENVQEKKEEPSNTSPEVNNLN